MQPQPIRRSPNNPAMSLKERTARVLIERLEQMGRSTAEAMGEPYGNTKLSAEDERRLFWLRDPQVDEQALWQQGKTPAEISKALYPHRWQVLTAGGRIKLEDQTAWAERQLRLGPPSGTPVPPEGRGARDEGREEGRGTSESEQAQEAPPAPLTAPQTQGPTPLFPLPSSLAPGATEERPYG
jgi:hypothetical protein